MTNLVQGTAGQPAKGKTLRATGVHGSKEYRFYEFPNGRPPGQVKAYVLEQGSFECRVPFDKLPTMALQRTFIACTGKSPNELGVTIQE